MNDRKPFPHVTELILHREPMLLVDEVLHWDEESLRCLHLIGPRHLLLDETLCVPSSYGIEMMAQSIACYAGLRRHAHALKPQVGFLLGARRYQAAVPSFPLGSRLLIDVKVEFNDGEMACFACLIRSADAAADAAPLAEARLNVYQPARPETYLESDHVRN